MAHTREKKSKTFSMGDQVAKWQDDWQDDLDELHENTLFDDEDNQVDDEEGLLG
jgi:hypothetical protein